MDAQSKKSFLTGIPAWALAIISNLLSWLFLLILFDETGTKNSTVFFLFIVSLLLVIFLGFACFYICKHFPRSVWFTPFICNAHIISSVVFEIPFWTRSSLVWIMLEIAILFSLVGALIGRHVGKSKNTNS